jgi:hypothetical protein
MIDTGDLRPRNNSQKLCPTVEYPQDGVRYTLQWIVPNPVQTVQEMMENVGIPANSDAAFVKNTGLMRPSGLLLHYNYGAAVVKHWGKNISILTTRPNIPRPPKPAEPARRPPFKQNDRNTTINKLDASREGGNNNLGLRGGGVGGAGDTNEALDADDIIMLLWSSNPRTVQRRIAEEKCKDDAIDQWRLAVSVNQAG